MLSKITIVFLWVLVILQAISIVAALDDVSKGKYLKTENPTTNAISAVINTIILICLLLIIFEVW